MNQTVGCRIFTCWVCKYQGCMVGWVMRREISIKSYDKFKLDLPY